MASKQTSLALMPPTANDKTDGCGYKWEETCTRSHGASCPSPSSFHLLPPASSPGRISTSPRITPLHLRSDKQLWVSAPLAPTRRLPVHMATGWPPSHTRLRLRDTLWPLQPTATPSPESHDTDAHANTQTKWFKSMHLVWNAGNLQVERDKTGLINWVF